ncbi:ABC transporter permease [Orrella sp. NBD-18]|uniref:Transport permease protein n=2 Tax=Sheuella amnicola TaxID=2707330 RepID=A0A6B2QYG4_9BURK|nr:ABC transporter permease [Sheuella amnicola]
MIQALWGHRSFIVGSVKREFQSKYSNSLLGAAWTVIRPLMMIIVYTVVFSQIMRAKLAGADTPFAYSIYLCAGILTWSFFSEIVGRAENIFIENANLIKKVNFPRLCLPVILIANASINFAIIFGLFTVFLIVTGTFPGLVYFAIFPVLAIQILFSAGLGITIGVMNVFFRDIGQLFAVVLQLWFWVTPVVYPMSILPSFVQGLVKLNPMTNLINAYQGILVNQQWPDWYSLWPVTALSIFLCFWGVHLFRKHVGEMVDEL